MLKHVLVPLDGSSLSEVALDHALKIISPDGRITLLSVVDSPTPQSYMMFDMPIGAYPADMRRDEESFRQASQYTHDYLAKRAQQVASGDLVVESLVRVGVPETVIIEEAAELGVDAIVMCTHGRSGLSRWLFGSVTQRVLSAMPCPVFVIPGNLVQPEGEKDQTAQA